MKCFLAVLNSLFTVLTYFISSQSYVVFASVNLSFQLFNAVVKSNNPYLTTVFQLRGRTNKTETKVFRVTVLIPQPTVLPPKVAGLF